MLELLYHLPIRHYTISAGTRFFWMLFRSVVYNLCTLFGLRSGKFYATKLFSLFSLCIVVKPFPIHLIYFLRFGVLVNIDVLNERVKTLWQERCKNSIFFAFRCSIDGHTQVHFVSLCEKLFCMKRHIANWFWYTPYRYTLWWLYHFILLYIILYLWIRFVCTFWNL